MKLHYSQTEEELRPFLFEFQYLMKLHYSQTNCILGHLRKSFSTLWNYTTLKLYRGSCLTASGFSTLWNYTTLKLNRQVKKNPQGFSTLWNYTTLKPELLHCRLVPGFSTLWNYTTLKPGCGKTTLATVSVPYEITLLSNPPLGLEFLY